MCYEISLKHGDVVVVEAVETLKMPLPEQSTFFIIKHHPNRVQ